MNQSVLVYADIDEGAELGHVGHNAFQNHSRLRIGDFANAFGEAGRNEFIARIAARLLQLFENVVEGKCAGGELSAIDFLQQLGAR